MRSKKLLFFAALTLILALGLVGTGIAVAAPAAPAHSIHVTGGLFAEWHGDGLTLDKGGQTWSETGEWRGALLGDLMGTFTEDSVISGIGAAPEDWDGRFWYIGSGTFTGTLNGDPISFTYRASGRGYNGFDALGATRGPYFEVDSVWTITSSEVTYSHLRGSFVVHTYVDGGPDSGSTYTGTLTW